MRAFRTKAAAGPVAGPGAVAVKAAEPEASDVNGTTTAEAEAHTATVTGVVVDAFNTCMASGGLDGKVRCHHCRSHDSQLVQAQS